MLLFLSSLILCDLRERRYINTNERFRPILTRGNYVTRKMEKRREQPSIRNAKNECFDEANEETESARGDDDVFGFFVVVV